MYFLAAGISASVLGRGTAYSVLGTLAYSANIILNLYAASFITIRLLVHRRLVLATRIGNNEVSTVQHLYIIGILLESAAINVPVAIAAAVGIGTGRAFVETVMTPAIAASQVCSPVPETLVV